MDATQSSRAGGHPGARHLRPATGHAGSRLGAGGVCENDVGGLLTDHVNRGHDEEPGDVGKDRRIDDAQPLRPVDTESAVDNSHRVSLRPHLAGARSVVAPRLTPDVGFDLLRRPYLVARKNLAYDRVPGLRQDPAYELDAQHEGLEVFSLGVVALLEIMEVDGRRFAWVRRPHADPSRRIPSG